MAHFVMTTLSKHILRHRNLFDDMALIEELIYIRLCNVLKVSNNSHLHD